MPVLSGVSVQTGSFVEHDGEASWWHLRGPDQDFQGFGRVMNPAGSMWKWMFQHSGPLCFRQT